MPNLYGEQHRALQDRFDTRRLADKVQELIVHTELTDADRAFIESRDMFWLATIDHQGQPTVSYKGGAPGFVRVLDPRTLAFPAYDGNGMFYSMGNIVATGSVGMLFMDLEKPFRFRVQGEATVSADDPLLPQFPGAQLIVRVLVTAAFQNCPRYVHRYAKVQQSRYVPDVNGSAPLAGWKRIEDIQPALPHYDVGRAEQEGGCLSIEQWSEKVASGDPEA
ncbi:MAG TPA: pyridoxamine 5'-phosphate oxidase family protein [Gemmatimonadales bacterium]|nr:pyridoxamine 5'-phosphate oxidase family protein [Gemmatimonadales bacterium]